MPVFKLKNKNSTILYSDAYKICPELKVLSEKELLYIILSVDYDSPSHQFPEEERMRRAKRQVYGEIEESPENTPKIKKAIEFYKSLQYDPRRETIIKYRSKIESLGHMILSATTAKEISDLDNAIEKLMDRCKKIQNEIDSDDALESVQLKGGGKLSFLEKWQKNRVSYLEAEKQRIERIGIENLG